LRRIIKERKGSVIVRIKIKTSCSIIREGKGSLIGQAGLTNLDLRLCLGFKVIC